MTALISRLLNHRRLARTILVLGCAVLGTLVFATSAFATQNFYLLCDFDQTGWIQFEMGAGGVSVYAQGHDINGNVVNSDTYSKYCYDQDCFGLFVAPATSGVAWDVASFTADSTIFEINSGCGNPPSTPAHAGTQSTHPASVSSGGLTVSPQSRTASPTSKVTRVVHGGKLDLWPLHR